MSPDDAEDGSHSPDPDLGDLDESGMMAEEKIERASSDEEKSPSEGNNETGQSSKPNAKDPGRPRRKKARRACFACQRAHLTCGDERPCGRCIKRGLQDQCHDGVRKKAKYLHDAPPEVLVPGFAGNYHVHGSQMPTEPGAQVNNGMPVSQPAYFQQPAQNYQQYPQVSRSAHAGPSLPGNHNMVNEFTAQPTVETPTQYQSTPSQQTSPVQDLTSNIDSSNTLNMGTGSFDSAFFDPNDTSMFNFNISDLNFGNHYGALEFGMLGHMSGAVGTPEVDIMNPMGQTHQGSGSYDASAGFPNNFGYTQTFPSWQTVPNAGSRQSSATNFWNNSGNADAFAIGEQGSIGQSPHSQGYSTSPETQYVQPEQTNTQEYLRQSISQAAQQQRKQGVFPTGTAGTDPMSRKRRRDTAEIYNAVTAPYSYTAGFHALTKFLEKRFHTKKVLRIAKALAEIRPSFISCNQHLNHDDLIFMEKCFQRTLCEYEDFVNHYGTPTIICRRTGEVAAVSKEFSLITGWKRDVLLGKEANLNVNTGGSTGNNASGTQTGTSSRGAATPRVPNQAPDPGRPQAVFLAELMDEDSVVQFYEDFAELAFGASNTAIIGAACSLLKYRTKEDPGWGPDDSGVVAEDGTRVKKMEDAKPESLMRGEAGSRQLGLKNGMVECSMCWTVKRDVFDIPMLIVMNMPMTVHSYRRIGLL
ncbi:Transcriptional regulator of nonfermentable carbon utilization [Recurvomyces mirabilis]|nr:Transcriptional regulator of nonfermentable carbon utilization [Recurvomyces mirabilis]